LALQEDVEKGQQVPERVQPVLHYVKLAQDYQYNSPEKGGDLGLHRVSHQSCAQSRDWTSSTLSVKHSKRLFLTLSARFEMMNLFDRECPTKQRRLQYPIRSEQGSQYMILQMSSCHLADLQ
jgi:hypothetical protein